MRDSEGSMLLEIGSSNNCAHLPARATRLLNRSRLQQQCPLNNADSDSSKSAHSSIRRSAAASRASTASTSNASPLQRSSHHQHQHHHQSHYQQHREAHSSSDDLMLYDKSFRNAMIQDVLQFKKQLLRLRRILQETETLNPFENDNGQLFASCGLDSKLLDDIDLASLTSSTTDDPMQELADLRRQGQVDDRDRTIRLQRNLIDKLEAEKPEQTLTGNGEGPKECINMATQTERTRPLSIGPEGLSSSPESVYAHVIKYIKTINFRTICHYISVNHRSKPEYTSYTTHFPAICGDTTTIIQHQQQYPSINQNANQTRRHTIISTTLTNYNHQLASTTVHPRRASIAWDNTTTPAIYKPVKITLIGEPLPTPTNSGKEYETTANGIANGSSGECKQKNTLSAQQDLINGISRQKQQPQKQYNGFSSARSMENGHHHHQPHYQQQNNSHHHHHHHQHVQRQKPKQVYQLQTANGNLNPTVTIV